MKYIIPVLTVSLFAAGCSPRGNGSASQSPTQIAPDLQKTQEYFKSLYGAPKSEKHVTEYAFSLPGHGSMIHLTRPFIVDQFQSDKLTATVVYSAATRQALWVNYRLPNSWTQAQINAALKAYGSEWKIIQESLGMDLIMQAKAPVAYRSSAGTLAYKTMVDELIVYAPQLYADLRGQIEETERQKQAVPKF